MINHFRQHLLNRKSGFFTKSLFPTYSSAGFTPVQGNAITKRVDTLLFGENADASLCEYRFVEFLRIIRACSLYEHVVMSDSRETYRLDDFNLADPLLFVSSVIPSCGVSIRTLPNLPMPVDLPMRCLVTVTGRSARYMNGGSAAEQMVQGDGTLILRSLGVEVKGLPAAADHLLDIRNAPHQTIADVIRDTLTLTQAECHELFAPLRDTCPEYEAGFRRITDTLYRFCMILFAQALNIERLKSDV
jgi:hypothetical protein